MSKFWYGVVHAIVECEDCEWKTGSYKNAQAIAKIHAKKHGHRVKGELTIDFGYDFREVEGSESPLNLALAFTDVKKKKGFGEKK